MSTNEGFGPRFRRLREKVDEWAKGYDERRAADKAFLERDKKRVEAARAAYKQRVKVYGNSGAKAEGKPFRNTRKQNVSKETRYTGPMLSSEGQSVIRVDNNKTSRSPITPKNVIEEVNSRYPYSTHTQSAPIASGGGEWNGYTDAQIDEYAKGKSVGYLNNFDTKNPLNIAWHMRQRKKKSNNTQKNNKPSVYWMR